MRITICGSITFYEQMLDVREKLREKSHQIELPPSEVRDGKGNLIPVKKYYEIRKNINEAEEWVWERKKEAMRKHFDKVNWSDAILVTNYDKRGINNYIGDNTLMEMGLALYLDKGIYLLHPIPEINAKEEILAMQPTILDGDLSKIK